MLTNTPPLAGDRPIPRGFPAEAVVEDETGVGRELRGAMSGARTAGTGRRFELVLLRLRPPGQATAGIIAKHASRGSYHWVLVLDRPDAGAQNVARLLAVAYLDEASGTLGRGDPLWSIPRAYLRDGGLLEVERSSRRGPREMEPEVRGELRRVTDWLADRHRSYVAELCAALRGDPPEQGFTPLDNAGARDRGFFDPTGRGLLAPHPPPVVTRTPAAGAEVGHHAAANRERLLPWRGRSGVDG